MQKASASGQQSDAVYGVKEKLTHVSDIGMDLITFEVMRNAFVGPATRLRPRSSASPTIR